MLGPYDIRLKESDYGHFVDLLYGFSRAQRLNVLWFGSYQVDMPQHWYESGESTGFKFKAYIQTEENGYIFASEVFDRGVVQLVAHCGKNLRLWHETLAVLESMILQDEQLEQPDNFELRCE
jgi:hypothetical protein